MKQLIVAADDFGLTTSINEGITRARRDGIVTSINIIPTGEAFDDAVRLAHEMALKEIGAHLALTETAPVTHASGISTLIASGGAFRKGHTSFGVDYLLGRIDLDEIYVELRSQLDKVDATGFRITNLSSHEHIHMLPDILDIFVKLAREYDVPAIRYPHGEGAGLPLGSGKAFKRLVLACFEKGMEKTMRGSGIARPDHFLGFLDSGNLGEEELVEMLGSLKDGTTELVCHPGFLGPEVLDRYPFHKNCEAELSALTSPRVRKLLNDRSVRLVSYGEYLSSR
jgi:chitin disaccharide deacetylase